ncbi:MAG: alpha-glucan family phosphorylase [Deltaproteobacteria bacterium]|nr:alpha-glucan family phosphorylase [Deltaproteobacteria bacterium]
MPDLRSRLIRLAQNLRWSWNEDLHPIFRLIDVDLWRKVNHNPIAFLNDIDPATLEARDTSDSITIRAIHAEKNLRLYLEGAKHWATYNSMGLSAFPVAYFCSEFCIHESLPIYSGGLGVLAGDHLKSCSDLGIPVHGVSLLYRQGYFIQQIDANGNQIEVYQDLDTSRVPLEPVKDETGETVKIVFPVGEEQVTTEIWKAKVGRCVLLLLDVIDVEGSTFPRVLRLYGGDMTTRIVHEIALGIGGYRALRAIGVRPGVIHLNEGHSAFAVLEAICHKMEETGMDFDTASDEVADMVVFTTHTPVEAGHDYFDPAALLHFLRPLQRRLRLSDEAFLGLGRINPADPHERFCMTVLALKLSRTANAVSSLHGNTSRRMWHRLWPDRRLSTVPIGHVTNGAHVGTWMASELDRVYCECLGSDWKEHICSARRWRQIDGLDEFLLWSTKIALKRKLFDFIARRLEVRRKRLGISDPLPNLREDVLTIGFARRVAAYKRCMLFFTDLERAKRLLSNPQRPVQLILAGKAHPSDRPAKDLIRKIYEISQDPELRDRVVIIENHDKNVSRHLIEGCDLWLNSPRRPLEACGTSGMKAVFNATLNCSTLDGWWDEAYDTQNGFAFGDGLINVNPEIQDRHDAESLFNVLESQVVPTYYAVNDKGMPERWIKMIKNALKTLGWRYNADRMVKDYVRQMYMRAAKTLTADIPG